MAAFNVRTAIERCGTTSRRRGRHSASNSGLALVRRAGKQRDQLAIAFESGVEPLARRAAVQVGQQRCALQHVGLLQVVLRHRNPPGGGAGVQRSNLRSVAAQCDRKRFRRSFAGQVVFGRSQSAHHDQNVDAAQRRAKSVHQVLAPVADDGLECDRNAEFIQLLRDVERVGVLAKGSEHLGADGNDLAFHRNSFQLLAFSLQPGFCKRARHV